MKKPTSVGGNTATENLGGLEKETARTVEVAEKAIATCEKLSANTGALDKVAKAIEESTKNLKAKNDSLAIRLGKVVAALVILLAGVAVGALSLGTSGLNYGQAVAAATQAIDTNERVDTIRMQVESVDRKADKILLAQDRPVVAAPPAPAPGDYAGQSTRFNVATKYCKSLVTMTPAGRDGAAKKLEALEEKKFQEQMWDCHDPNWRTNGQRVEKSDDDDDTPKTVAYRARGRGGLSAEDTANLRGIAKKVLGPLPADARAYDARVTKRVGSPARGCQKVDVVREGGGTFARWRCPRGTINKRSW